MEWEGHRKEWKQLDWIGPGGNGTEYAWRGSRGLAWGEMGWKREWNDKDDATQSQAQVGALTDASTWIETERNETL